MAAFYLRPTGTTIQAPPRTLSEAWVAENVDKRHAPAGGPEDVHLRMSQASSDQPPATIASRWLRQTTTASIGRHHRTTLRPPATKRRSDAETSEADSRLTGYAHRYAPAPSARRCTKGHACSVPCPGCSGRGLRQPQPGLVAFCTRLDEVPLRSPIDRYGFPAGHLRGLSRRARPRLRPSSA